MNITRKEIESKLQDFVKLTGINSNLVLNYNSCYGGYIIRRITNDSGGYVFFGSSERKPAREMYNYITGMERGYLLALETR
jgi:hypothetical protein